jgi:hypothetical protein
MSDALTFEIHEAALRGSQPLGARLRSAIMQFRSNREL